MHFLTFVERDQAIALESVNHLGDGWRGEPEEFREPRRNDVAVFIGQRVNRLQVFLDRG
jgi:hypothetical protein